MKSVNKQKWIRNLQQFHSADEIFINRVVEQSVHQIIESRQKDICSVWRPLPTLNLMIEIHKEKEAAEELRYVCTIIRKDIS